jgi:hypothetical protein
MIFFLSLWFGDISRMGIFTDMWKKFRKIEKCGSFSLRAYGVGCRYSLAG